MRTNEVTQTGFQPPGAFITHLVKCGFKRYGAVNTVNDFEIHNLDLTSLNLDVGILVPFVISKRLSGYKLIDSEQLGKVLPDLISVSQSLQRKFAVLTVGGKLTRIEKRIVEDLGVLSIAVIDRSTIEGIMETTDAEVKARLLSARLVQYLGREALSPYVTGRPAIGGRFFGRSSLVKRIIPSSGNFTILGNRRIGKTSLLKEIRERLKLQNVRTAEVYGATCSSTSDVVYKLLQNLEKGREAEHVFWEPQRAKSLATHLHRISDTEKRPLAVFVDEVDRILEFDAKQNYELMHLLRG